MSDLKGLEALLERLTAQARALTDLRFAMLVERYREANPAAVSPRMGLA